MSPALQGLHRQTGNNPLAPDAATIERFLGYCHRRRYPPRTEVFRPGDPAGTLYYVISGSTSIITEEDDGRETQARERAQALARSPREQCDRGQ